MTIRTDAAHAPVVFVVCLSCDRETLDADGVRTKLGLAYSLECQHCHESLVALYPDDIELRPRGCVSGTRVMALGYVVKPFAPGLPVPRLTGKAFHQPAVSRRT
jgi:hypothetical protein